MHITINGQSLETTAASYEALRLAQGWTADVLLVDGHSRSWETAPQENDSVLIFDSRRPPSPELWRAIYNARYSGAMMDRFQAGRVAICGLGGLGSLIAIELARLGVGELLLIDCDRVDATNLARQHYTLADIGEWKTDALARHLRAAAPLTTVQTKNLRLAPGNIARVLQDWPIICEALDRPETKAALVTTVRSELPDATLVAASGMAGFDSGNAISARKVLDRFYLVGDGESEGEEGIGLMAPRVGLCASAQATLIMRLLLGETTP